MNTNTANAAAIALKSIRDQRTGGLTAFDTKFNTGLNLPNDILICILEYIDYRDWCGCHGKYIYSVCISINRRLIISGSFDGTIDLWNIDTGTCINTFVRHSSGVTSVYVSPDEKHIVSGSRDNTVKVWDAYTGACINTL